MKFGARVKENTVVEFLLAKLQYHFSDPQEENSHISAVRARKITPTRHSDENSAFETIVASVDNTKKITGPTWTTRERDEEVIEKCAKNFAPVWGREEKKLEHHENAARLLEYWKK